MVFCLVPFLLSFSHTAEHYMPPTYCKSGPEERGGRQTPRVAASQLAPALIVALVVSRFNDSIYSI